MKKNFIPGELVALIYAFHDCDEDDADGRYLVDPFDLNVEYGEVVEGRESEDDGDLWGAVVLMESTGEERWFAQNFVVTERD